MASTAASSSKPSTPGSEDILFQVPPGSIPNTPSFATTDYYNPYLDYPPTNTSNFPTHERSPSQVPLLPKRRSDPNTHDLTRSQRHRPQDLSISETLYDDSRPNSIAKDLYAGELFSAPLTDDVFIRTPSPSRFPRGLPKPARRHPFSQAFEPPNWKLLIIHTGLCSSTYPVLLLFVTIAKARPLFWTRFIVSVGCGLIGLLLGFSLLQLGKGFLEAATWATVIHQSRIEDSPGVKLKDIAANTGDSTSVIIAIRLLWTRYKYEGTSRHIRKSYDKRPWTLFIIFFIIIIVVAGCLPFALGRIIAIETAITHQRNEYEEIAIIGDSSVDDIAKATALVPAFEDFTLTWTLSPFSAHGGVPSVVSFKWNNETVYFAETVLSQLLPNGTGLGTFDVGTTAPVDQNEASTLPARDTGIALGSLLRYPRWGIRIKCAKIPDGEKNLITLSDGGFTYVFTPRDLLRSLFASLNTEFPPILNKPFLVNSTLLGNDTSFPNLDSNATALGAAFYNNGVAHSFKSTPMTMGQEGFGFTTIEHVLVRLNTTYTPAGKFLRFSNTSTPDASGNLSFVGYDAAVCVELYEPYVLEVYNATIGLPSSVKIVAKANEVRDILSGNGGLERRMGQPLTDTNVNRKLSSQNKTNVYIAAHTNSVNQIMKDNGRDAFYVPSPTVISFTSGEGPKGYTELSADFFGKARALADASNVLPYFAGTGSTLARSFPDKMVAYPHIDNIPTIILIAIVFLIGIVAGLFVPKLPLGVPRRGFELYSWMAAFHADELVGDRIFAGIERKMDLKQIEEQVGELKFRYHVAG